MQTAKETLSHKDRFRFVGVRLSNGQVNLLDICAALSGQTRTDLVREALAGFLPKLYHGLKGEDDETLD